MVSTPHPLRRWGVLPMLLAVLALVRVGVGPAAADDGPHDVVVIGAPGLSWSDVTAGDAPAIHSFAAGAAVTNLNVRSTYFTSCPSDGWLGVSAGNRAAAPRDVTAAELRSNPRALPRCGSLPPIDAFSSSARSEVAMDRSFWTDLSRGVADQGFDAQIGTLGSAVADAGGCISGTGDGAVLAMPDREGVVPRGGAGINEACAVTLVGVPPVTDPDQGAVRVDQVRTADAAVADALASAHPATVVILAGLSDDGGPPGLRVLAMGGAGVPAGWLHSDSTTRDEMAQVADVTYSALATAGITPPEGIAGRALVAVADGAPFERRRAQLVDDDAQLRAADRVIPPFFRSYAFSLAGLLLVAGVAGRFGPGRWHPALARIVGIVALAAMAMPASTYLVTMTRWFDTAMPMAAFVGWLAVIDAVLVAGAAVLVGLLRRRGAVSPLVPVGVIAGATWLLLAGDLVVGSGRMTMLSVLGLLPLDGGRFHGFGNVPFGIFTASAFLVMAALTSPLLAAGRRRAAVLAVLVLGSATFLIDAWLGADGGGALALIPSVGYLVLAVAGIRLTWAKVIGIGAVTVGGFLAMAGVDWLRSPQERTHLGRFFQNLLDGQAWGIIVRKLGTNVDLLLGPERTALLVPIVLVAVIWVLARPAGRAGVAVAPFFAAHAGLRIALIALVIALTAGFLLNDSGTAIPAVAALVLAPALVVVLVAPGRSGSGRAEPGNDPGPS